MIALKGIKMPQNCSECSFKANDYVCGLLDCAFSCNHFTERNYNCPLVEIVTCKGIMVTEENGGNMTYEEDMKIADTVPTQMKWIPCSERMPEADKDVLICTTSGFIEVAYNDSIGDGWNDYDGIVQKRDVLSWMPLPEPYKEARNDQER